MRSFIAHGWDSTPSRSPTVTCHLERTNKKRCHPERSLAAPRPNESKDLRLFLLLSFLHSRTRMGAPGLCSWRPGIPQKQTRHPDHSRFSGGGKYLLSLFSPSNPSSVPLRKSIVLSYRLDHSESLHKINPICALLIIGRRKSHGPNLFLDSGRGRFGEGTGPLPHPMHQKLCKPEFTDREGRRILVSPSLIPLSLCPFSPQNRAAKQHSSAMKIA